MVSYARKRECEEIIADGELACSAVRQTAIYERNWKNREVGLVLKKREVTMQKDRKLMGQRRKASG